MSSQELDSRGLKMTSLHKPQAKDLLLRDLDLRASDKQAHAKHCCSCTVTQYHSTILTDLVSASKLSKEASVPQAAEEDTDCECYCTRGPAVLS